MPLNLISNEYLDAFYHGLMPFPISLKYADLLSLFRIRANDELFNPFMLF